MVIRSLSINGVGNGFSGIRILSARQVHVENTTIQGFVNFGIEGANTVNPLQLSVVNTTLIATNIGIRQSALATNTASIRNVRIHRSAFGVDLLGGKATVSDSAVSHQTSIGLVAEGTSVLNVAGTVVSSNATGVNAFSSGSTINLANSDVFANSTGILVAAGGICNRFQNNRIFGNSVANITGTCNPQSDQ